MRERTPEMPRSLLFITLVAAAAPAFARAPVERRWVDEDGVVHISVQAGPTPAARAQARKLEITPHAARTSARVKVHETDAFDHIIEEAAAKYAIPPSLVRAVIVAESNFDPSAVSRVGARGLMQLMPATAADMFVDDMHDPVQNIHGGTRYLRFLANMFDGDFIKVVAAYNAGPEAVKRHKGTPPFNETQTYVQRVVRLYKTYSAR